MLAETTFWTFFWSALWFFFLLVWLMILFHIIIDLFRDKETSGVAKVVWVIFLLVLPFLAVFVYLVVRGQGMAERARQEQVAQKQQFDSYVQGVAGADPSDQIAKAKSLLDAGTISQAEFDQLKAKALS
ncbi:MAG TPA: SHOCT domain-containing protein [Actinomycetota bacterium]